MIESLKKAADDRIRMLRQEAEKEADKIRADAASRLEDLREDVKKRQALMAGDRNVRAVSEANRRARTMKLSADKALSDRLYQLAVSSLSSLRKESYEALFATMARELPPHAWQVARVNPQDVALAKKHFPGADIQADPRITGGMDVSAQKGAIRVVNTFEKRLERAWGDMLPALIKDVYQEANDGASPASRGPGVSDRIPSVEDQREAVAIDRSVEATDL